MVRWDLKASQVLEANSHSRLYLKKAIQLARIKKRHQPEPLPTIFKGMRAFVVDGRPVRAEVTKYHLGRLGVQVEIEND